MTDYHNEAMVLNNYQFLFVSIQQIAIDAARFGEITTQVHMLWSGIYSVHENIYVYIFTNLKVHFK